jgi:predicted Zn-dependent protease
MMLQRLFVLTLLLCSPVAMAADAALDALNQQIAANPNDKTALNKRSQMQHKAGRHVEALADLQASCKLEPDAQVQELCMMEVTEYAKIYSLPR